MSDNFTCQPQDCFCRTEAVYIQIYYVMNGLLVYQLCFPTKDSVSMVKALP